MSDLMEAFRQQAQSCAAMGSPFMERLLNLLADHWPQDTALALACAAYEGDLGPAGHSLPLRIAGGLHFLARGTAADLARVYPPHVPSDAVLREVVLSTLAEKDSFLTEWTTSPPQTNEIRRSAALMVGAAFVANEFARPVVVSELGASGGLNLLWDRYALDLGAVRLGAVDAVVTLTPDWRGDLPPLELPKIAERRGVDLNPLDPTDPDDLAKLSAYLWPDQPFRIEMTQAASTVAQSGAVDRSDAIDWLEDRLRSAPKGHLHLVQNTVAWQYFPAEAQARGVALMEQAGAAATTETPLAWLQLETDGDTTGKVGAALTLRLWPRDVRWHLGRADFHGRWIDWTPQRQ